MSYYKYHSSNSQNEVIFMSSSKDSFPYKMYSDMRLEFWRHQINLQMKKTNRKNLIANMISDNDTNAYNNTSSLGTTNVMDNNSDSSSTLCINNMTSNPLKTMNLLNTSENNEITNQDNFTKNTMNCLFSDGIPLNVDMSTQFNSDVKVLIEKDSKDENIVNIKLGGTFTGSLKGIGRMPQETFLSLISENLKESGKTDIEKPKMIVKPSIEDQPIVKVKSNKKKSHASIGSEESVGYFATTKPTEATVKDADLSIKNKLSPSDAQTPDVLSKNLKTDNGNLTSFIKSPNSTTTITKYSEPFTENQTMGSKMPSLEYFSTSKFYSESPAVLPTCIIRRIVRAMLAELPLSKRQVHKPNKLEAKVKSLTDQMDILNKNWHGAIKRGKVMIGELIELILSVNVDRNSKKLDDIQPVLLELQNEFIGCCVYLSNLTEKSKLKDHICLELIIDQMIEEIKRLLQLFGEWLKSNKSMDFSSYFVKDFTQTLSPNISEAISVSGTESATTTTSGLSTKQHSKPSQDSQALKIEKQPEQIDESQNKPIQNKNLNEKIEYKLMISSQSRYPDPSIITNSRIKKTMNTISQSAIEQNITNKSLPRKSRDGMIALEIIDDQPILKRNPEASLIKELNNQTELWKTPINAGRNSIQDLIEFIINTITQDKETSKELYLHVVNELENLERDLLVSVANNIHDSRISNDDLQSLCYEILAEIIFEEISVAKYLFTSLDPNGIENLLLGKLYRNYTVENSHNRGNPKGSSGKPDPIKNTYAHLTSEIMNYDDGANSDKPKLISKSSLDKSLPVQGLAEFKKASEQSLKNDLLESQKSDGNISSQQGSSMIKKNSEPPEKVQSVPLIISDKNDLKTLSDHTSLMSKKSSELVVPVQKAPSLTSQKSNPKTLSDHNSLMSKKSSEPVVQVQKVPSLTSQKSNPKTLSDHNSLMSKKSSEKSVPIKKKTPTKSKKSKSSEEKAPPVYESSTDIQTTDTEIKKESTSKEQNLKVKGNNSNEKIILEEGSNQLLLIISKLNNQTNEINKIKETLHILSNNVDEKLSNWTCKFVAPYDEKYPMKSPDKKNVVNFAQTTKLYNTQEVVPAPDDLLINIQPSEYQSIAELIPIAKKVENKSFIAPISNKTNEERVRTPNLSNIPLASNNVDIDVLKLIGEGAHQFLTSRQVIAMKPALIQKQDSCEQFNSEFDKIFGWIIDKYQETLGSMMSNAASKKIIEAMETSSLEEKRKIERELINRIIDQNNLLINGWVKEICFHKVLDCLS